MNQVGWAITEEATAAEEEAEWDSSDVTEKVEEGWTKISGNVAAAGENMDRSFDHAENPEEEKRTFLTFVGCLLVLLLCVCCLACCTWKSKEENKKTSTVKDEKTELKKAKERGGAVDDPELDVQDLDRQETEAKLIGGANTGRSGRNHRTETRQTQDNMSEHNSETNDR